MDKRSILFGPFISDKRGKSFVTLASDCSETEWADAFWNFQSELETFRSLFLMSESQNFAPSSTD
jgi:hypothetical protein